MLISAMIVASLFDAPTRSAVTNNAEIPIPSHMQRNIIIDCMVRRGEKDGMSAGKATEAEP
jgi:hypothetical protein